MYYFLSDSMCIMSWSNPICYLYTCQWNSSGGHSEKKDFISENPKPDGHPLSLEGTRVQASNWYFPL